MLPTLGKADSGTRDELGHRLCDKNLARSGQRRDPRADVDADPVNVIALGLDFARMHAGPDLEPKSAHAFDDGRGAANGLLGTFERRQKAVADGLDRSAVKMCQFCAYQLIVRPEKSPPATVTELSSPLCRTHDVGEQDGREDATLRGPTPARHPRFRSLIRKEFVNDSGAGFPLSDPREWRGALDDLQASPANASGDGHAKPHGEQGLISAVNDERWALVAAVGLVLLMIGAIATHVRRGEENASVSVNVVVLALALVVAWARFGPYHL